MNNDKWMSELNKQASLDALSQSEVNSIIARFWYRS